MEFLRKNVQSALVDVERPVGGASYPLASLRTRCPGIGLGGIPLAPPEVRAPPIAANPDKGDQMSVAKVSELSATSSKSFEDALKQGIARAHKTLRNVRSAWVKEQQVKVSKGSITEYQVNMLVTFVIDD
jgi:dodecin